MLKDREDQPQQCFALTQSKHVSSFDSLRAVAITLVYLQHQLAIISYERFTEFSGLSLGQLGVSIFLVLSAVLARRSQLPAGKWLRRRLARIYPAYIIVVAISFLLTYLSNYKSFDIYQVISQLLGTGLLTHSGNLVNTPTWFVTLILILYIFTSLAKRFQKDLQAAVVSSVLLLIPIAINTEEILPIYSQAIVYTISYYLFPRKDLSKRNAALCSLVFVIMSLYFRTLAYPAFGIGIFLLASHVQQVPKVVARISDISYEFYLCHGIFLVGSQQMFPKSPACAVLIGLTASIIGAIALQRVTQILSRKLHLPK